MSSPRGYFDRLRGSAKALSSCAVDAAATADAIANAAERGGGDGNARAHARCADVVVASAPAPAAEANSNSNASELEETETYDLRHLVAFVPLTGGRGSSSGVDAAAALLLEVHHFNDGVGDVVPGIAEAVGGEGGCRVQLTVEVFDERHSAFTATEALTRDVLLPRTEAGLEPGVESEMAVGKPSPTAVLGSYKAAATANLAVLTGVSGLVQLSFQSFNKALDNKDEYPLYGTLSPDLQMVTARPLVSYLRDHLGVTHFGVLTTANAKGAAYAKRAVPALW